MVFFVLSLFCSIRHQKRNLLVIAQSTYNKELICPDRCVGWWTEAQSHEGTKGHIVSIEQRSRARKRLNLSEALWKSFITLSWSSLQLDFTQYSYLSCTIFTHLFCLYPFLDCVDYHIPLPVSTMRINALSLLLSSTLSAAAFSNLNLRILPLGGTLKSPDALLAQTDISQYSFNHDWRRQPIVWSEWISIRPCPKISRKYSRCTRIAARRIYG